MSRRIQYLRTLLQVEGLCKFNSLGCSIGTITIIHLKETITGLGTYFSLLIRLPTKTAQCTVLGTNRTPSI